MREKCFGVASGKEGAANATSNEGPMVKRSTLQRHNTKNSKQIFPTKPILLQENIWTDPGDI